MIRARALASVSVVIGVALLPAAALQAQDSTTSAAAAHSGMVQQYCVACHSGPTPFARLNLENLDFANFEKDGVVWEKVIRKLRMRAMPPQGMPRPPEAQYDAIVKYMENGRDSLAETKPNPGRPTLHRLNRTEYANAVRDLLSLEVDVAELLPADDIGYGFDNIGDVLQVSPFLMERYLGAARKISRTAIGDTAMPVAYQTYNVHHGLVQNDRLSESSPIGSRGGTTIRHYFPVDGEYEISVTVQRSRDDEYLGFERERKLDLRLDDERLLLGTLAASDKKLVLGSGTAPDANLKARVKVDAGTHQVGATFMKDSVLREGIIERIRDDNVQTYFEGVSTVTVAGPFNVQGPGDTATRDKIFICKPTGRADEEACAERVLSNLAHRAYRRPVTADDLPQLMTLYRQGAQNGGFEVGRQTGDAEDTRVAGLHLPCGSRSAKRAGRHRLHDQRHRACFAPVVLLVEQHSGRGAAFACGERALEGARGCGGAGQAHACRSEVGCAGQELCRSMAVLAQYRTDRSGFHVLPVFR